jgi:hypothetical protein
MSGEPAGTFGCGGRRSMSVSAPFVSENQPETDSETDVRHVKWSAGFDGSSIHGTNLASAGMQAGN